eukprot:6189665-Pleurochrysis_carterae.AAC.1
MHRLACRAAGLPVFAASLFLSPTVPVVLPLCVACVTPMRFLVHASGNRMFGFAAQATAAAPARSPLTASARTALLDALTLPGKVLDACAAYSAALFLVATAGQAAVAVAPVEVNMDVARRKRVVKGGCALWVTLATLAGTPYHQPGALAASKLCSYVAPG